MNVHHTVFTPLSHTSVTSVDLLRSLPRSVAIGSLISLSSLDMRHLLTALVLLDFAGVAAQPPASSFGGGSSYGPASSSTPPPPPTVSPNSVYDLRTCQNRQSESASPAEGYALQFGPQTIATAYVDTYVPRPPYSTGGTGQPAGGATRDVRRSYTGYAYQPRACRTYHVPWHHRPPPRAAS